MYGMVDWQRDKGLVSIEVMTKCRPNFFLLSAFSLCRSSRQMRASEKRGRRTIEDLGGNHDTYRYRHLDFLVMSKNLKVSHL